MLKKWISTGVFLLCLMCSPMAFAYVDDAGVMNQFDYDNATPPLGLHQCQWLSFLWTKLDG